MDSILGVILFTCSEGNQVPCCELVIEKVTWQDDTVPQTKGSKDPINGHTHEVSVEMHSSPVGSLNVYSPGQHSEGRFSRHPEPKLSHTLNVRRCFIY